MQLNAIDYLPRAQLRSLKLANLGLKIVPGNFQLAHAVVSSDSLRQHKIGHAFYDWNSTNGDAGV